MVSEKENIITSSLILNASSIKTVLLNHFCLSIDNHTLYVFKTIFVMFYVFYRF